MNEKEKEAIIRDYQRNKILDELVGLRKEYKNYLVEISKDGDIKRYGIRIKKYREIIATLREREME